MNIFEKKINLDNKKHPADMLKNLLKIQSKEVNATVKEDYSIDDLLKDDASLDPEKYTEIYNHDSILADKAFIREREIDFSGANLPNVRMSYQKDYGVKTEDEFLDKWREKKSREKNGQMEMAVTMLLSQKLGKDFLVVRTALYDDYKNGVDNLILDRLTGEVVGAFDEVHEGGDGHKIEEKKRKIQKIADRGGAEIRYGLKLSGGKLSRASLKGIPVFYLGLESKELVELEQGLSENNTEKIDQIFDKLLDSLVSQHQELEKNTKVPIFRAKLTSFAKSLSRITHAHSS